MEVLVATMHRKNEEEIIALVDKMNILTNAVIINQNDSWEEEKTIYHNSQRIKYISVIDRGLSKSRNLAIKHATDDIIIIADDDMVYCDNYEQIIKKAYEESSEDAVAFFVKRTDNPNKADSLKKNIPLGFIQTMKLSSVQLTFKRASIINLQFDEQFGSGAKYQMGEENIFLFDFLKNKKSIKYISNQIAIVNQDKSTWFTGFNDEYLYNKGVAYKRMFGLLAPIMNLQFVIRKRKLFQTGVLFNYRIMISGTKTWEERK